MKAVIVEDICLYYQMLIKKALAVKVRGWSGAEMRRKSKTNEKKYIKSLYKDADISAFSFH